MTEQELELQRVERCLERNHATGVYSPRTLGHPGTFYRDASMKAIRFHQFGEPERVLSLEDVRVPEPGPGEVRVRFTHRPINPSDLQIIRGIYPVRALPPASPGLEGVGRIDALGDGVSGLAVGQRVVSLAGLPGTWAEQLVIPAIRALPIPDAIPDAVAAQAIANPVTAWAMVNDEISLREGDWLLQTAAGSTLATLVIQLARRRGVRTLNVVRRRSQVADVLSRGGDAVVCTDEESLAARVREITGGEGVAAAFDSVGGTTGAEAAACLRPRGTMLSMGLLSGEPLGPIDTRALIFNGTAIRGFWIIEWFGRRPPEVIGNALTDVLTLLATGALTPTIEGEYPLADFRCALEHVARVGRRGKVILAG